MQERAGEIGVSLPTLSSWQKNGVDVFEDEEIVKYLRTSRKVPPNVKARFLPKIEPPGGAITDVSQIDIDSFKLRVANAQDKNEAQVLQVQVKTLLDTFKLEEANGNYISRSALKEEMVRLGATFKAAVKRLEADLPPMLEGASPEQAQKIIGEKCDEVLRGMKEEYEKVKELGHDE